MPMGSDIGALAENDRHLLRPVVGAMMQAKSKPPPRRLAGALPELIEHRGTNFQNVLGGKDGFTHVLLSVPLLPPLMESNDPEEDGVIFPTGSEAYRTGFALDC